MNVNTVTLGDYLIQAGFYFKYDKLLYESLVFAIKQSLPEIYDKAIGGHYTLDIDIVEYCCLEVITAKQFIEIVNAMKRYFDLLSFR